MPGARIRPDPSELDRPLVVSEPGLPFSLRHLLEDAQIQRLLRHQLLELDVLTLQPLKLLYASLIHPGLLLLPPIVALLADALHLARLCYRPALPDHHLNGPYLLYDLFWCMSLFLHLMYGNASRRILS